MINLEGLDLLGEIGGVSADVAYIANAQWTTSFELHGRDGEVAVIGGHDADALLRLRRAARRRLDCFRLCPLADWPRLDRDLCGRLGFGACRSPGQRLLPCFLSDRLSFSNRLSSCTRSLPKFLPLSRPMNRPRRPKTGARHARERKAPEYLQAPPSPIKK